VAGSIQVTTTADEFNTSGNGAGCSLREAIHAANIGADFGGCTGATTSPNTITFSQAGQAYELSTRDNAQYGFTGTPVIASTITIEGNGGTTIRRANGAPSFRLFHVAKQDDFTGAYGQLQVRGGDLTLHNLTLSKGVRRGRRRR
jgi:CSLREA domain-containing protein